MISGTHFCTLFSSNYLARGLTLYKTLKEHVPNLQLTVLCMDELTETVLQKLALPGLRVLSLKEFETPELLQVKPSRSKGEYCWTCTPSLIWHELQVRGLADTTYVDSDLGFFSSPQALFEEFHASGASVLLTEHRYSPEHDQSATSGIYCVQFMTFRKDERGLHVLSWWRDRCLEWCYNRFEDGKFGDQKYLDDWTTRFQGIHVLKHLGGGVAPWNIQQYKVMAGHPPRIDGQPLVFFHYHNLRILSSTRIDLCRTFYHLPAEAIDSIYSPYVKKLTDSLNLLQKTLSGNYDITPESLKGRALALMRRFKDRYYVVEV